MLNQNALVLLWQKFNQLLLLSMAVLFTGLTAETFAASDENDKATTIKHEIIDDLNNRSRELAFINPSVSFKLADSALNLSENYKKGKAYAYRNIANIYVLNNFLQPRYSISLQCNRYVHGIK